MRFLSQQGTNYLCQKRDGASQESTLGPARLGRWRMVSPSGSPIHLPDLLSFAFTSATGRMTLDVFMLDVLIDWQIPPLPSPGGGGADGLPDHVLRRER